MSKRLPDMVRRQQALDWTVQKYRKRDLDFSSADCVRMVRTHLVKMGHRGLPKLPAYSSVAGARRALKEMGHDSLESLLDSILPRIAPARALAGDVVVMRGEINGRESDLDSIGIALGLGKVFGWYETRAAVFTAHEIKAAYRA